MCGLSSCTTTRLLLSLLLLVVSSGPSCWTVPWQERACTASAGLLVAAAAHSTPKEPSDSEPGAIDADTSLHQQHGGGHGASTQGLLAASSLLDMLQQLRSSNQAAAGSTSTTQLLTEGGDDVGTTADDGPYSTGTVMLTELTEPASLDVLAYLMGPDGVVGSAAVTAAATATAMDSDSAVLDYGNVKAEGVAGSASSSSRRLTEDGSSLFSAGGGGGAKSSAATSSTQPRVQAMDGPAPSTASPEAASPSSTGPGATPQQQQQQQPLDANQQAGGLAQDCSLIDGGVPALELADKADIVVTGIALAAGPGTGMCFPNGTLGVALANVSSSESVTTSFVVLGLQCVHKGLVRCRSNPEDTGDCLILVEIPIRTDVPPCSLSQGARYIFHLQRAPDSCDGFHLAMYQMAYHTIRPPLGGTGCSFFPCYPPADDLTAKVAEQCKEPVPCDVDMCSPQITRSPCANDTAVSCNLKVCPGKFMYFNAIMPQETCYELYTYKTSGLPVNCYGQRYINNRIAQLAAQKAQLDAMQGGAAGGTGGTGSSSPGDDPSADTGA